MIFILNREQNEGDAGKISVDSLNKYGSMISISNAFVKCGKMYDVQ